MLDLNFDLSKQQTLRVLCIGAHCDDIEIGCGATLRALQGSGRKAVIDWVVLSGGVDRRREAQRSMRLLVKPQCRGELQFGQFPDGRFPAVYTEIKNFFESMKSKPSANLILCHQRDDRHQDHRVASEMTWSTFRDHVVLEYETPKWDGDLGQPNIYVPVNSKDAKAKVDTLMKSYPSQANKDWYGRDTFMAMLRLRGLECRSPSGYAEAFYGRKLRFRAC
jgi:LmbE family N-acetylglucosaminyl deacetylase